MNSARKEYALISNRRTACSLAGFAISLLLLVPPTEGAAQVDRDSTSGGLAYKNATLDLCYFPPVEMQDTTERSRVAMRAQARAAHASSTTELLLAMASGFDDTSADWHSLKIETYPRDSVSDVDDTSAEARMSAWVAGFHEARVMPKPMTISGQTFAVSLFERQEGAIKKGAVIWTTVRKGKLLSFAFVANSPEQLTKLTVTMKSVQFF
jgi:hypothetical protein